MWCIHSCFDLMLIFDLEVKFIGFLTCVCVWSIASVCFDIAISYMAHRSITIKRCVEKIHDHNLMLTFNLKVKVIGFLKCLYVQSVTSVCFYIGIEYLAWDYHHGIITMRGWVAYIHDPNTMLTLDLKVKVIGVLTWLCVWATAFLSIDTVKPYLTHQCITIGQCVTYIHDLCMTLTFGLNIKIIFSPWICVRARLSLLYDIDTPNLALGV